MKKENQLWLKPSIKNTKVACLCCGSTSELLPLETQLYNGFGGWMVVKNGELFYQSQDEGFDESKNVHDIENEIGEDNENEYLAILFSPLRGATYQRHKKNHWVLIEENEGFA